MPSPMFHGCLSCFTLSWCFSEGVCGREMVPVSTSAPGPQCYLDRLRSRSLPGCQWPAWALHRTGMWTLAPHLTALVFLEGIQLGQEKTMSHPWGSSLEVKLLYH